MTANRLDLTGIARRAMLQHGLQPDFTPAAIAETAAIGDTPNAAAGDTAGVRDLRDRLWSSIDNDDSKDLDQLTVAEPVRGGKGGSGGSSGAIKIFVAIADVDALVKEGSAIDDHARTNTTSVYTAAGIFPMLPEKLSTDLTSLNQDEDRLAIVIEMTVDADGEVTQSDVYRARVLNQAKLTYNGVAAWLDGEAPAPPRLAAVPGLDEQIKMQDRVARALNARRHQRGALDLDTRQARPVFSGDTLADLRPDDPNRAKALIEDFMIAANGVTATYLDAKGFPSLRRVLRTPKRWERIVEIAAQLGERLPAQPNPSALQQFLNRRREADPARFPDLSLSVVKLLGSGEYAVERAGEQIDGHFGLAAKDYTHSTAPNRRFPDLTTQRMVKAALAGRPSPETYDELKALAQHCTEQEDNAAKVERQVQKSAAALLLASRIGDRFDGIVTGASEKGTWVRVTRPSVEGKVVQGAAGLDVGDRVQVRLVHTDVANGFIDFARI
jgi:VacB/RNase II family 3'-5' exoribonuclease